LKNKILITIIAVSVIGIGLFTTTNVMAQDSGNGFNRMQSLVAKIADKFGLKIEDVQEVFDQEKKDRQAEMEAKYLERLNTLVSEGKITDAQKQLILNKHNEMKNKRQTEMQNMQGKTGEERKALMEAKRSEREKERKDLETWATQSGIDVKYLMGGFGKHGGMRGPGLGDRNGSPEN
jgi:Skp family chaperone for outer membrane proteins